MHTIALAATFGLALLVVTAHAHDDDRNAGHGGHAAALGQPGDRAKVARSIAVEMNDDMRFVPDRVEVRRGETIRFVVHNGGKVRHEMVLGSARELKAHAELMRKFPGMEHADPKQVSVEPGGTAELVWRFTRSGTFDFACLQPGHYEAGMTGKVAVR
jgi:uncharacterized cupredoxin-like copper-binding protein